MKDEDPEIIAAGMAGVPDVPLETEEVCRLAEAFDPAAEIRRTVIPTTYNHCKFRSRLEARWGCFFDVMHLKWEYEPEGIRLRSGHGYLPDFYLSDVDWFCEIKPNIKVLKAENKASEFALQAGFAILLLPGPPDFRSYTGLSLSSGFIDSLEYSLDVVKFDRAYREGRLWSAPDYDSCIQPIYQFSALYIQAVEAARSERFAA